LKLNIITKYLRHTRATSFTLEAEDMSIMKLWVDATFAVHSKMRSHTRGVMMMRLGEVYGVSTKTNKSLIQRAQQKSRIGGPV